MPYAPGPIQFVGYALVGGVCAIANVALFLILRGFLSSGFAAAAAFALAAVLNYILSVRLVFRSGAMWRTPAELVAYSVVVVSAGSIDVLATLSLLEIGLSPATSKAVASAAALLLNFLGRRYFVFRETGQRRGARMRPLQQGSESHRTTAATKSTDATPSASP
jgi:putative flippase GtrA